MTPIPLVAPPADQASPSVVVDPQAAIVTEKASPPAANAVHLTRKKDDEEALERRWFGS